MLSLIVIATYQPYALARTLGALADGAVAGLIREAVVAARADDAEAAVVADAAGATLEVSDGGFGARLQAAMVMTRGERLMVVEAGFMPPADWIVRLERVMAADLALAGWLREAEALSWWQRLASRLGLPAARRSYAGFLCRRGMLRLNGSEADLAACLAPFSRIERF